MATSDLGKEAALKAIARAGLTPADIGVIIVGTVTPDMMFPSTACLIQHKIGAPHAWGFDLSAACSAFTYSLTTASQFVATGAHEHALVVGADVMSSIIDYTDRSTCVLFGDGAGAVVVSAARDGEGAIIDFEHEIDGSGGPALCMPAGGSLRPPSHETIDQRLHYVKQDGATVFKFAVRKTEEIARRVLDRNGLKTDDLDLFVSHQANRRIIQSAAEKLGVDPSKVIINIERFGNTTAATIPLALNDAVCTGRLKKGDSCCSRRSAPGSRWGRCCCAGASDAKSKVKVVEVIASFCSRPPTAAARRASRCCRRTRRFALAEAAAIDRGAPLGDLFAFVSGLYFRGKLAYARRFAAVPEPGNPVVGDGIHVITPNAGLRGPTRA